MNYNRLDNNGKFHITFKKSFETQIYKMSAVIITSQTV